MKQLLLILFTTSVLIACQSEPKTDSARAAEVDVNSTPSSDVTLREMNLIKNNTAKQADILSNALKKNFDADLDVKALDIFQNALLRYDADYQIKAFASEFLSLAKDRPAIENFTSSIRSSYATLFPDDPYVQNFINTKTIATLLDNKAELINNKNFNRFSVPDAKDYIEMSEGYALMAPRLEEAGTQLIKAGNTAKSIPGYAAKAVVIYDWVLAKYPAHPRAGQALFLKAFTYDNEMNQSEKAADLYKEFIRKYPKDDFADDAQLLLDNIGKTDQEFYESIVNKKNKK